MKRTEWAIAQSVLGLRPTLYDFDLSILAVLPVLSTAQGVLSELLRRHTFLSENVKLKANALRISATRWMKLNRTEYGG